VGAFVGWLVMMIAKQPVNEPESLLGRMLSVVCSLVLWSLFAALMQQKEICGGGTVELSEAAKPRMKLVLAVILLFWLAALILYAGQWFISSGVLTALLGVIFISELCWRDPLVLLKWNQRP